jgi:signal transduction histidine kinase
MKFSLKIFIAVFLTTLVLGSSLILAAHHYVSGQTREEYVSRYSALSKVMGDALTRLDGNTESLMLNAAKVVEERDAAHGILSTESLSKMRDELSVTHIFVTDKSGNFIRSTNEDPTLIPNAFSFCPAYRDLVTGKSNSAATPIIPPRPEPKPYKFVFVPSRDHQRLLEVGTRVDFIAKTLTDALGSDSNIVSMSLFAPDGSPFGKFSSKAVEFTQDKLAFQGALPQMIDTGDSYQFLTKVTSSHPSCCQCDISGISKNGEYYYVLKSDVSKKELNAIQATTKTAFFILALGNLLFSFFLSRFISRRLVKNIETATARIRAIKKSGDMNQRVGLAGHDEVSYLTNEFDHLLDSLEESHLRVLEAEKVQARVEAARDVAHNIKSPVVAVEMMLPMLSDMPQRMQNVFRDSVSEIKELVERLGRKADALTASSQEVVLAPVDLNKILESVVYEKQVEYSARKNVKFVFSNESPSSHLFANVALTEFRSVISNLINNAVESYSGKNGIVNVSLGLFDKQCEIQVEDFGRGIPSHVISKLGAINVSSGKIGGRGIGLSHAYRVVAGCCGRIEIKSALGQGTTINIYLPRVASLGGKMHIDEVESSTKQRFAALAD